MLQCRSWVLFDMTTNDGGVLSSAAPRGPDPYLQTSGLIKQTECGEGVNSCLITNESNDNNNHVPSRTDVINGGTKGAPKERCLQARQQLGQELRRRARGGGLVLRVQTLPSA